MRLMRPVRHPRPGAGEISPLAQKRCSQRTALAMLTPKRLAAALRRHAADDNRLNHPRGRSSDNASATPPSAAENKDHEQPDSGIPVIHFAGKPL